MVKGPRNACLLLAFCLVTLVAANAWGQNVPAGADPVALLSAISANPDFDIAGLWRTLKVPAELDSIYSKVGTAPPPTASVPFDSCANACRAELTRANVDDDLSD